MVGSEILFAKESGRRERGREGAVKVMVEGGSEAVRSHQLEKLVNFRKERESLKQRGLRFPVCRKRPS